jgi:hypothetical protein
MVAVCCVVDVEISPISASAPVLKIPIGVEREQREPEDDGTLAAELIGKITEQQACECDAEHGRILKRRGLRHAETKLLDDLRDDHTDRIGGHGKHHEHQIGEPFDHGDAGRAARRCLAGCSHLARRRAIGRGRAVVVFHC